MTVFAAQAVILDPALGQDARPSSPPLGWSFSSPRPEIEPRHEFLAEADGPGCFVIRSNGLPGSIGFWRRQLPVTGGRHYRFTVLRNCQSVEQPERTGVVRLIWLGADDQSVLRDEPSTASYLEGERPQALPEFPRRIAERSDGWVEFAETLRAPTAATSVQIELWYRWDEDGEVRWSLPELAETEPPPTRPVRLAAVHFQPRAGKTAAEKCAELRR